MVTKGERGWWGKDKLRVWDLQILYENIYNKMYIKQMNNKVLLFITGNYIQYPIINRNGKGYEKEYICV